MRKKWEKYGLVVGILLLLMGTTIIPRSTGQGDEQSERINTDWWPMFHHDLNHSGYSTSQAPESNNIIWTYQTNGPVMSSPSVVDGKLYVGSADGTLYCLNAETGVKIWGFASSVGIISSPAIQGTNVFIGAGSTMYCLDAATGEPHWDYDTDGSIGSSPAVADGKVFFGSNNNSGGNARVYCRDASSGSKIWDYETSHFWLDSSPAYADEKVYIAGYDGFIYCFDAATGVKIWSYALGDYTYASPTVVDGKVYIGPFCSEKSSGFGISCLDADTGVPLWFFEIPGYVGTMSSVAVNNDMVYFGARNNMIYCLDVDTGTKNWEYTTGGNVESSPAVADVKIYVGSLDHKIYCLDAENGENIWEYDTGEYVYSSPAIANGNVYIGSNNGKIYCFGNHAPETPTINGPTQGKPGTSYNYNFIAVDPDGDDVSYFIDWGDNTSIGWSGPYPSGQVAIVSHTYLKKGSYIITCQAKDRYDAMSDWGTLSITIPYSSNIPFLWFWLKFFQRFPHTFPILQQMLGY